MNYNFYIQRYSRKHWNKETSQYDEEAKGELIDIEARFKCKYVKFEGLSETGKVKNIYTETYAETEELRMYIPDEVLYENTDLSLTLLFAPSSTDGADAARRTANTAPSPPTTTPTARCTTSCRKRTFWPPAN